MRTFLFLAAATWILGSCQFTSAPKESGEKDSTLTPRQDASLDTEPATRKSGLNRESVLLENATTLEFDGKDGEEQFRVALFGDRILDGTVAFTIRNGQGELIYTDEFPASMLAASYDETINTPEKQEALIRERIDEFFDEDRFKQPAIEGNQPPHDSYFIEKSTYDDLRQTNAPGFLYLIGKENTKHIAWSSAEQKVVMYFNCC